MSDLGKNLVRTFHHRSLSNSTGAIAGLASGLSLLVGLIAAHFAPHGIHRLTAALHITRQPLVVRLAPWIAGLAAAAVTAAGIIRFYSWCREREERTQ